MELKEIAKRVLPQFLKKQIFYWNKARALRKFRALQTRECPTQNLRSAATISLQEIFASGQITQSWNESKKELDRYKFPDGTGGVNPGDRRAIYYLVSELQPSSFLEIGTHIGASTLHIASALHKNRGANGQVPKLITIDIRDVNSPTDKPWLSFGAQYAPAQMIDQSGFGDLVTFVADKSLNFFTQTKQTFDFIFLDGDHSHSTVYKEIPAALSRLNPNGVILLHDYFPNKKPLWSNGSVIEGPVLAVERLIQEGADLQVLALGGLPWATKLGSNVTSLALLLKK